MDQISLNSNLVMISADHIQSIKLMHYLFKHFNKDEIIFESFLQQHQRIETPLFIDTKYYTCEINIHSITYSYFESNPSFDLLKQLKVDGILFIVDANNMQGLEQFTTLCDSILTESQPGLQAIIYNRKEGTKINYELLESEEKKLEAFVEAIYLDLDQLPVAQEQKKLAEQDDETLGFPRVIEILECNTWSGMRPKSQEKQLKQKKIAEQSLNPLDKLEYEDEQFAQLIHDMAKIRTSKLSDEERREKAANLMNQLMNMCEDDEEEDL